jgi:RNA 2',3'-cyclic 3'-phosphodiesterase
MLADYRLFVCVELPGEVRDDLAELRHALRATGARVSWVAPSNIHLTLAFLGDVAQTRIPTIASALDETLRDCRPIELCVEGSGAFPSLTRPRVIWAGVGGEREALGAIYRRVAASLARVGVFEESKPFSPHLTLGRVKDPRDPALDSVRSILASRKPCGEPFLATEITLMRSELLPHGPRYTPLNRTQLKP